MKPMFLKKTFVAILALAFAGSASATCTGCVETPSVPTYTSALGATVFGGIQSATAGQSTGTGAGTTVKTDTFSIGDELFKLGADVNYKVDAACGPACGDQVARVFLLGEQKVGAGALNTATSAGPASSHTATGTAAAFQGTIGAKWGATLPLR